MMESIEKLRELAHSIVVTGQVERAIDDIADEIEREIAEKYLLLPVDADVVPIHPGNYVLLDGKGGEVWLVGCRDVMCSDGMSYTASALNHVKPDPVKELLDDVCLGTIRYPRERITGYLEDNHSIGEAVLLDVRDRLTAIYDEQQRAVSAE